MEQVSQESPQPKRSVLGCELPRVVRVVVVCLMAAIPVAYVLRSYASDAKFSGLLHFGSHFFGRALPEVKACAPAVTSEFGYDGQFYCQVATDPLLRDPQLPDALDLPAYRATRISLPLLAYVAGAGRSCVIIQAFALLNLVFWLLLLFGMVHYLRARTIQDFLCVFAAVMTSGALFSLHRSLVDLPAATLAFYAASLVGGSAVAGAMMMLLTKETYVLALPTLCWSDRGNQRRVVLRLACALAPLVVWYLYAHLRLGFIRKDLPNTGWPLAGVIDYVTRAWQNWVQQPTSVSAIAKLLAPVSLLAQTGYLLWRRDWQSAYWRMGIGFAFAYVLLSPDVFVEQVSFTRDVIPLTVAFNIAMMKQKGWRFAAWFVAGNAGLYWGLWKTVAGVF